MSSQQLISFSNGPHAHAWHHLNFLLKKAEFREAARFLQELFRDMPLTTDDITFFSVARETLDIGIQEAVRDGTLSADDRALLDQVLPAIPLIATRSASDQEPAAKPVAAIATAEIILIANGSLVRQACLYVELESPMASVFDRQLATQISLLHARFHMSATSLEAQIEAIQAFTILGKRLETLHHSRFAHAEGMARWKALKIRRRIKLSGLSQRARKGSETFVPFVWQKKQEEEDLPRQKSAPPPPIPRPPEPPFHNKSYLPKFSPQKKTVNRAVIAWWAAIATYVEQWRGNIPGVAITPEEDRIMLEWITNAPRPGITSRGGALIGLLEERHWHLAHDVRGRILKAVDNCRRESPEVAQHLPPRQKSTYDRRREPDLLKP